MEMKQVKAIITGGASGLGLATARYLCAQGAQVSLLDVSQDKGLLAVDELGSQSSYIQTDVTSEPAVLQAVATAKEHMQGVNTVIHCAGVLGAGRVLGKEGAMPLSQFETTIRINLVGCFNVTKAAVELMQQNSPNEEGERGVIIHTASIAAFEGQIGQVAYSASKGGVVSMTLPMAREFARFGVRVVTIAPGVFHTPMVEGMPQAVYDSLCAQVPYPARLGKPSEFAETVGFVITNSYLNGATLRVDGAIRLQPK
jgi:NAD(P)-dependent dehydrogenase (short-subunit alcohol dehydrogenase family)